MRRATLRQRFWRAVMRYAMKRTGLRRYNQPEPTEEEWAAYASEAKEWAEVTLPAGAEILPPYQTSTTWPGTTTVIWTTR